MRGHATVLGAAPRRYARALFAAAAEQGALAAVRADLALLAEVLAARQLGPWLADPRVEEVNKLALLEQELGARSHALTRGLLAVLGRRQRMAIVRDLPAAFAELLDLHEGRVRGLVEAARPLDPPRLARLEQALSVRTGKTVVLEAQVEPSLLGGVRVTLDGVRYDGSARGRLEQMRRQLAAAELAPR